MNVRLGGHRRFVYEGAIVVALCAVSVVQGLAANRMKTIRVDHGRPVVVVSQKAVLLLEFRQEPVKDALLSHEPSDIRHCRAHYRYELLEGATGLLTNGEGTVEEIFQTVSRTATGSQVKDVGSHTHIGAGEFSLSWSEGGAGARSWLYYQANSAIRFIQQPSHLTFEAADRDVLQQYLASKNVHEFVSAGKTVQVIGPAVFTGDLPDETPVAARIESCRIRDGAVELSLANLATNKHYIIESSYEVKAGNWNAIHTFTAHESNHAWSDPLAPEVSVAFYRIREGK